MEHTASEFAGGFADLASEIAVERLPLHGTIPTWLRGNLVRNGPGRFTLGEVAVQHWFDGFAMLHRFTIADGQVGYANRLLQSRFLRSTERQGRLGQRTFTTDPRRTWFTKLRDFIFPSPGDNALVNIIPHGGELLALTESTAQLRIDPRTLAVIGPLVYTDRLAGHTTTAHPHVDGRSGDLVNLLTKYGKVSSYQFYRLQAGGDRRDLIGVLEAKEPSYTHSFGLTDQCIIMVEYPFVTQPLAMQFGNASILGSYRWKPELQTRIRVIDRASGRLRMDVRAQPRFGFHHVNAFHESDQVLVVDVAANDTPEIVSTLFLAELRRSRIRPFPLLHRYRLHLSTGAVEEAPLSQDALDFPVIDSRVAGKPTRIVYGNGIDRDQPTGFLNRITRLDLHDGQSRSWSEPGCYPGEAVLARDPRSGNADVGALLSVVFDARSGTSFLLILDAETLAEMARARLPHAIPFGFHGQFIADQRGEVGA
jgi:carotenoid cleavage dioxygenase-like enzyme